jgi:hypothetical protein
VLQLGKLGIFGVAYSAALRAALVRMHGNVAVEPPQFTAAVHFLNQSGIGKLFQIPVNSRQTQMGHSFNEHGVQFFGGGMSFY